MRRSVREDASKPERFPGSMNHMASSLKRLTYKLHSAVGCSTLLLLVAAYFTWDNLNVTLKHVDVLKGRAPPGPIVIPEGIHGRFNEEAVVDLIGSIAHKNYSHDPAGKPLYDTCLITVSRNQVYLKEFLVRNLLSGFQLIVLLDDSWDQHDSNISNLIRPFVDAGVVVYSRRHVDRNAFSQFEWMYSYAQMYAEQCKWIARLDDDEVLYPIGYPEERLPEWLKGVEDKYCEVRFNWLHPYSEGLTRRHGHELGQTLMSTYPRMCFEHRLPKHIFQPQKVTTYHHMVHWSNSEYANQSSDCLSGLRVLEQHQNWSVKSFDTFQRNMKATPRPLLIHYYTKSLEDFVTKKEQSIPPHWRYFHHYYDEGTTHCSLELKPIPYAKQYIEDVERVMEVPFTENPAEDRGGIFHERPALTAEEVGDMPDFDLYLFVKEKMKDGQWLNQSCYYETYPEVVDLVKEKEMADATIHFAFMGFKKGMTKCWQKGKELVAQTHVPSTRTGRR